MDYGKLEKRVRAAGERNLLDFAAQEDYLSMCRAALEEGEYDLAHMWNKGSRERITSGLRLAAEKEDFLLAERFNDLLFRSLLFGAQDFFDDYLQAVEFGKPYDKKFYAPRRHYLKRYVDAYQEVLEGKLDFLSISMPKRCGKSQTGINFVNMISGKRPDKSTLMEGTGDALVNSFYQVCLEYLQNTEEYHFHEIFPEAPLVQTNADSKTINLFSRSRFPTIMCRSIDSRQVGLSEATNLLYLDDTVEGREEAHNRERLDRKWEVLAGDVIGRALEGTPIVICGTRYSLYDPMGHLQEEMLKQGKRCKIIEIPALDPVTDETNFEFQIEGKKYFTTEYFRNQRQMLSAEQWESEFQQQPFEAKGLTLPKDELNYYYNLPTDRDPDAIYAFCDTAEGGGDFTAMPIIYIYGEEWYAEDVVYDDAPPNVTKPECVKAIMRNKVASATFESNNAGTYYARDVSQLLNENGYVCNVKTKRTISNKETRIELSSDTIKKKVLFKDPSTYERGSQYDLWFREITTHTRIGKVKHDDGIDALSMAVNELRSLGRAKVEVFSRPF